MISRVVIPVVLLVSALLAADVFVLPVVTPALKKKAGEYYDNECKGCHRWARKFAAPPMKDIAPMSESDAKTMAAWLLYILEHPDDPGRPK